MILFAALVVVAGVALRCRWLWTQPLWLDESYSVYAATKGLDFLWTVVPRYETHPPFYYTLLHFWTLAFGDSTPAVRTLGLICGLATLPVALLAAREAGAWLGLDPNRRRLLAGTTLLLVAIAPFLIDMTRETRPYPVIMLVTTTQLALLFSMARRASDGARLWSPAFAAYLVMLALMLWLHNLGALHAGAAGLAFLILVWRRDWTRADWLAFVAGHLVVAAVWAPAILILLDQAPTWMKSTWLSFSWGLVGLTVKMLWAAPSPTAQVTAGLLFLMALATLLRLPRGGRALAALVALTLVPLALATLVSITLAPVLMPRTMTPTVVPMLLLFALGFVLAVGRLRLLALAALFLLAGQMIGEDIRLHRAPSHAYWHGMINWVAPQIRPGDMIFTYPNEAALPIRYAIRDLGYAIPVRPIPTDMPTLDPPPGSWNPTGSRGVFSLTEAELNRIAASPATRAVPTVWLMRMGPEAYDRNDLFLKALKRDRVLIASYKRGPIDMYGLRRADLVAAAEGR